MFPILLYLITAVLLLHGKVQARSVFAHYLVNPITQAHAISDIDEAKAMGLDGFALNVADATAAYSSQALSYLFPHAEAVGFQLFISMDLTGAANICSGGKGPCNGPYDYHAFFVKYTTSSAWTLVNGKPMISTFSSGGYTENQWLAWRNSLQNNLFFIPDFDETAGYYQAATGWWSYWGTVVDGLFSWESCWPEIGSSTPPGDVGQDAYVLAGAKAHNKLYMIGVSTLQYKDSYGANVYRPGSGNLPNRLIAILNMNPSPDFVEVITWNDGPESHYIGTIWPELYPSDILYMGSSHAAWQPLISAFIPAYKNNGNGYAGNLTSAGSSGTDVVGAVWYKPTLQKMHCPPDNGGTGGYNNKPSGYNMGDDNVYWALAVSRSAQYSGLKVRTYQRGVLVEETAVQPSASAHGLYWGSAPIGNGDVSVTVVDDGGGTVVAAGGGPDINKNGGCPLGIYSMNPVVLAFVPPG